MHTLDAGSTPAISTIRDKNYQNRHLVHNYRRIGDYKKFEMRFSSLLQFYSQMQRMAFCCDIIGVRSLDF